MLTQDEDWVNMWWHISYGCLLAYVCVCIQEHACAHQCGGQQTTLGVNTQDIFLLDLFVWLVAWLVYFLRQDLYIRCWPETGNID